MTTLFTKIVNGEIPCHKILEDERYLAFLDIRPIRPGHTLVIPKQAVDYVFDLDDDLLGGLMVFAKTVAFKLKEAIVCQRIGVVVAGLEVPHAHVHLIPMDSMRDLDFTRSTPVPVAELALLAEKIRKI